MLMNLCRHRLLGILKNKLPPVKKCRDQEIMSNEKKHYEDHVIEHEQSHKVASLAFFPESHSDCNKLKESDFYEIQGLKYSSIDHASTCVLVACVFPSRRWCASNPVKKYFVCHCNWNLNWIRIGILIE